MVTDAKLEREDMMQTENIGGNNLSSIDFMNGNCFSLDTSIDKKSSLHALARRGEKPGFESPLSYM